MNKTEKIDKFNFHVWSPFFFLQSEEAQMKRKKDSKDDYGMSNYDQYPFTVGVVVVIIVW